MLSQAAPFPAEERPHRFFLLIGHPQVGASIGSIAPNARDRERLDPRASAQSRERGASAVGSLARSQDLESADSMKAVTCAAFVLLPPSDFLPPRPRRSSGSAVIPFSAPMLVRHRCQLNKVCCSPGTATSKEAVRERARSRE